MTESGARVGVGRASRAPAGLAGLGWRGGKSDFRRPLIFGSVPGRPGRAGPGLVGALGRGGVSVPASLTLVAQSGTDNY